MAADIELTARQVQRIDEDGLLTLVFAASDDPEDGYVLIQWEPARPEVAPWVEVSDEIFGAQDAIEALQVGPASFALTIRPALVSRFGMVGTVEVRVPAATPGGAEALTALATLPTR
ncbi:MAG: hypothetical protein IE927_11925 [Rhodobacterales bacterium]|nr:hypothetical protein [Rhodobacterales bacterium]